LLILVKTIAMVILFNFFLDEGLNINWRSYQLVLMFRLNNIHNRNLFKKYLIN